MAASYNRVILMGNLTRDPELKQAPSGSSVVDLRLAVSERYRNKQTGATKEVACYVDVVAWDRLAELCQQYLAKGRGVLVEGRLQYDEWKTKEGDSRNKLRVRADIIRFLGSPSGARETEAETPATGHIPSAGNADTAETPPSAAEEMPQEQAGDADDLPF